MTILTPGLAADYQKLLNTSFPDGAASNDSVREVPKVSSFIVVDIRRAGSVSAEEWFPRAWAPHGMACVPREPYSTEQEEYMAELRYCESSSIPPVLLIHNQGPPPVEWMKALGSGEGQERCSTGWFEGGKRANDAVKRLNTVLGMLYSREEERRITELTLTGSVVKTVKVQSWPRVLYLEPGSVRTSAPKLRLSTADSGVSRWYFPPDLPDPDLPPPDQVSIFRLPHRDGTDEWRLESNGIPWIVEPEFLESDMDGNREAWSVGVIFDRSCPDNAHWARSITNPDNMRESADVPDWNQQLRNALPEALVEALADHPGAKVIPCWVGDYPETGFEPLGGKMTEVGRTLAAWSPASPSRGGWIRPWEVRNPVDPRSRIIEDLVGRWDWMPSLDVFDPVEQVLNELLNQRPNAVLIIGDSPPALDRFDERERAAWQEYRNFAGQDFGIRPPPDGVNGPAWPEESWGDVLEKAERQRIPVAWLQLGHQTAPASDGLEARRALRLEAVLEAALGHFSWLMHYKEEATPAGLAVGIKSAIRDLAPRALAPLRSTLVFASYD